MSYRKYYPIFKSVCPTSPRPDYNKIKSPFMRVTRYCRWRLFYDLAPHQIDILQDMFGCILEANGYKSNRGGLYPPKIH